MSERRAEPRVNLSVPLTIYDGQAEITCRTIDISPIGLAAAGVPESLPSKTLRVRLSLSERAPSIMCDCFPVGSRPGQDGVWGLRVLDTSEDLRLEFRKLIGQAMDNRTNVRPSHTVTKARELAVDGTDSPTPHRRTDSQQSVQDLYRAALKALE